MVGSRLSDRRSDGIQPHLITLTFQRKVELKARAHTLMLRPGLIQPRRRSWRYTWTTSRMRVTLPNCFPSAWVTAWKACGCVRCAMLLFCCRTASRAPPQEVQLVQLDDPQGWIHISLPGPTLCATFASTPEDDAKTTPHAAQAAAWQAPSRLHAAGRSADQPTERAGLAHPVDEGERPTAGPGRSPLPFHYVQRVPKLRCAALNEMGASTPLYLYSLISLVRQLAAQEGVQPGEPPHVQRRGRLPRA